MNGQARVLASPVHNPDYDARFYIRTDAALDQYHGYGLTTAICSAGNKELVIKAFEQRKGPTALYFAAFLAKYEPESIATWNECCGMSAVCPSVTSCLVRS